MAVFAGRIRVGLSHKSIEAVDHKLSGWRVVNDRAPCHQLLQFEGAPDAQHRALRNPESRRETTAAPARGTRRFFVQRLGKHCLHQGIADRAWRARTRLIGQTRQALREEACAPFADGLRRNVQALGALAIGATSLATEHDPCSHRQRPPALTTPRPLLELLLLVACQGQGLQFCARLHRAFGERTAHPGRQVRKGHCAPQERCVARWFTRKAAKSVPRYRRQTPLVQAAEIAGIRADSHRLAARGAVFA